MAAESLKVVVFSGGRGTGEICHALLKHPQISLTVLVNAYDDGLSTGRLRAFIPGMLGPSDVRKNIARFMECADSCQRALQRLVEYRLPDPFTYDQGLAILEAMVRNRPPELAPLTEWYRELNFRQFEAMAGYARAFLDYAGERAAAGTRFDFADCSIGNILFSGCYLACGQDFNRTVAAFSAFCRSRARVLNITCGENLVLVGLKEGGQILANEAELVSPQDFSQVNDIYLLARYLSKEELARLREAESCAARASFLAGLSVTPQLDEAAGEALTSADIIIYGPGTQHSSLFPSYLTRGVAEAIAGNANAEKIFVSNIQKDHEIQGETANSLIRKLLFFLNRKGEVSFPHQRLVTTFFLQFPKDGSAAPERYVTFDRDEFPSVMGKVVLADWEARQGVHLGGRVLDELLSLVNLRWERQLRPFHYMVSIVVPALNEVATVAAVLEELKLLDFQHLGIGKEIIVVDGGSDDGTYEAATAVPDVKVYRLAGRRGRGAALRHGVDKASGNIIAFFPSDGEYAVGDLRSVVAPVVNNDFPAVFGSRAFKCVSLSDRLHTIYQGNRVGYLLSKYGGMLISIVGLLLYNRYVNDALTGVKAFDAGLLKGLRLRATGVELETELVARLSQAGVFILEVPVDFYPRTRRQGKKIRAKDGFAALWNLFRCRFK